MKRLKRVLAAMGASLALLVASPVHAAADPPQKFPTPDPSVLPGTDTAGIDGYCPFGVRLTYLVNDEKGRATTDANGDQIQTYTGHLVVAMQNIKTGKAITFNSSGPGVVTTHPDGSYTVNTHGNDLFFTTVRNTYRGRPAVPQIYYSSGHLVFTVAAGMLNDNTAPTVAWSLTGKLTNVCLELASH